MPIGKKVPVFYNIDFNEIALSAIAFATVNAVVHAAWKLKPPVTPSMSRISPAKKRFGRVLQAKVVGLMLDSETPPQVTNSSLNGARPSI